MRLFKKLQMKKKTKKVYFLTHQVNRSCHTFLFTLTNRHICPFIAWDMLVNQTNIFFIIDVQVLRDHDKDKLHNKQKDL